ncbi:MAG: hypothetical protein HXS54_05075 [Theionarchaea archaeon]|nr:hypothetical protein [Theionarchaea archaeon]
MDVKRPFYQDTSLWILILTNGATIYFSVSKDWSLLTIMIVYWVQSVIIGTFSFFRILSLKEFSTENFYINDKQVPPTEKTKHSTAYFFAFHYGFFHAIYASFLFVTAENVNVLYILSGGLLFFVDHFFSFRYNRKRDEKKKRNIGTLMFFPYARIIPMHLIIVFYGAFLSGKGPLIAFLGLKTAADAIMHIIEHEM